MRINSLKRIKVKLIWFDSMGAKSSSVFIETPDVKILIDPGASAMQPSYPLPNDIKWLLNKIAYNEIEKYAKKADITIITHYHYDHHTLPSDTIIDTSTLYKNKIILVKDPNKYINNSQWERARIFFEELYSIFGNIEEFEEFLEDAEKVDFQDPMEKLPLAKGKDLWGLCR
ncbi:MAG: MBL fold metallo-hydrolase [Candidatus Asgardarchaeia archaeon]